MSIAEKPLKRKPSILAFGSDVCNNASLRKRKKQALEEEHKQTILEQSVNQIAEIQARPYISITEATILFGISKDTIRRLIKTGKIPAFNLGERLTRVSRIHLEAVFTAVDLPKEKPQEQQSVKLQYEPSECYTINEISEKYGVSLSTVSNTIRRNSIPKRQVGKFVYVPKEVIDKIFARK